MRRIGLAVVLALSLVLAPLAAEGQEPGKVYRIGVLWNSAPNTPVSQRNYQAFEQGLRERGWVEGQNTIMSGAMRKGGRNDSPIWRQS
jgi:hypothetical protein